MSLPEVHGHGDGELLVVDGEDVEDLHVDVNMDRVPSSLGGGLQLLVVLGQAPSPHTLGHACTNVDVTQPCPPAGHYSPLGVAGGRVGSMEMAGWRSTTRGTSTVPSPGMLERSGARVPEVRAHLELQT